MNDLTRGHGVRHTPETDKLFVALQGGCRSHDKKSLAAQNPIIAPILGPMADQDFKEIGRRLKAAYKEAGKNSAADLAHAVGLEPTRVRNWCNGSGRPTIEAALLLKKALRVDLDWIYEGDPTGLPMHLYVRLTAREAGQTPPAGPDPGSVSAEDAGQAGAKAPASDT